jgi:hypothetical protein
MRRIRPMVIFICTLTLFMMLSGYDLSHADLTQGLIAYYPFNGNANNATGSGNNGTSNGATLTTDRFGHANSAYSFDGINDYIVASANGLPTATRTISLWFYADTMATHPSLLSYGGGGGPPGTSWLMLINNRDLGPAFEVQSHWRSNRISYFYATEPTGAWYNWVVTTDASGTKMYLNGQQIASNATFISNTIVNATTQLSFGVDVNLYGIAPYTDSNSGYFAGKLDDIRIYNRALSEEEIQQLYAETDLHSLTLTKSGSGTGRVTSTPVGIDCGTSCSSQTANFAQLTQVTLTAQADAGSTFMGWSGGGCAGAGQCVVAMNSDTTVGAQFVGKGPGKVPSLSEWGAIICAFLMAGSALWLIRRRQHS